MDKHSFKVLLTEKQISQRVDQLAERVSADYRDCGELILLGVLKGAFVFLADLSRRLTIARRIEFMAVSSYDKGSESSGSVKLIMDTRTSIEGKHVLVVEDIIDSGRTLQYLTRLLKTRNPASLRTCSIVRKLRPENKDSQVDYLGFDIPDKWVVGYGLDWDERYRALPTISELVFD